MKQFFTHTFIFLAVGWISAQQNTVYPVRQVEQMVIFPGCENIENTDKKALTSCLAQQLTERLKNELGGLDEMLRQSNISEASAKVKFVVSREGVIIQVESVEGSNPILGDASARAIEKIAMEIPPIKPAKLEDGEPVNLFFHLPVRYKVEEIPERNLAGFPADEIVLFTLLTDEKELRYEVRWFKNKDLKVYEIRNNQANFLGKFLTLNELENSEPYKSLIQKYRNSDKILVTDGYLDNEFFEIYIYNLFDAEQRKPIFVEVVQMENQKTKAVFKFKTESEFNNSKFATLIFRD